MRQGLQPPLRACRLADVGELARSSPNLDLPCNLSSHTPCPLSPGECNLRCRLRLQQHHHRKKKMENQLASISRVSHCVRSHHTHGGAKGQSYWPESTEQMPVCRSSKVERPGSEASACAIQLPASPSDRYLTSSWQASFIADDP